MLRDNGVRLKAHLQTISMVHILFVCEFKKRYTFMQTVAKKWHKNNWRKSERGRNRVTIYMEDERKKKQTTVDNNFQIPR